MMKEFVIVVFGSLSNLHVFCNDLGYCNSYCYLDVYVFYKV